MSQLLWATAAIVAVYSALKGYAVWHTGLDASAVVVGGLVAGRSQIGQRTRSLACSFGLLTAAAMGVHVSGGVTEAHFSFFVVVVLLTLYEDWTVFVLAVVYTLVHHGVLGMIDPAQVFFTHTGSPWGWAAIHAVFVAAGGAAGVVAWRLNEDVRRRMRETQDELRDAAMTDALTGLPNRRRLMADLETAVDDEQARLALFDLDGFKSYNDTFGHLAGDALLTRLGHRLREGVAHAGVAYRLGGDEFCVLASGEASAATIEAAVEALTERGGAFTIGNSHGTVVLDDDVRKPEDALRIADQRMYERKNGGRRSAGDQSKAVLVRALSERHPDLVSHSADVSRMAELVARELDVAEDQLDPIRHAAELHDIGKVGIPDAMLAKPAELDAEEWAFMRRHTIIGERIVAGAPALAQVGRLVRSSHERWDGAGYPDELKGEEIPIGSRIIAVCDAFDAMLSERPYKSGRNTSAALAELRRCSGTQFDPAVVEAFCVVMADELAAAARRLVAEAVPQPIA
ncbi:MAG TPA: diguanylate cyclase [Solirubrobacteraceae bacterium]|nr:diguanylate cyclase [Solirubrobacteraceae bacterium]